MEVPVVVHHSDNPPMDLVWVEIVRETVQHHPQQQQQFQKVMKIKKKMDHRVRVRRRSLVVVVVRKQHHQHGHGRHPHPGQLLAVVLVLSLLLLSLSSNNNSGTVAATAKEDTTPTCGFWFGPSPIKEANDHMDGDTFDLYRYRTSDMKKGQFVVGSGNYG
mmetsp:Transcript_21992/g.22306  ORF Transcript_21992/g.22306 Transcript_21992/m.22306 type:complete len:161 (-) Transcript_21992:239-721(-)